MHFPLRLVLPLLGLIVCFTGTFSAYADEGEWKVGFDKANITPEKPVMLLGYPSRPGVFSEVAGPIYAKAAVFEDGQGNRAVVITADLVGFQRQVTADEVIERIESNKSLKLTRDRIIFNASHVHTGPVCSRVPNLKWNVGHPQMSEQNAKDTVEYTNRLRDQLVTVIESAVSKLEPAKLSWGVGEVKFPMSRRMPTPNGVVMAANVKGLADRTTPVLRVDSPDGKTLRGVLFGAACHNVAAGQANAIYGDYAGEAQAALEAHHPGCQAMFVMGCGADANPEPWGSLAIAKKHGEALAAETDRVLADVEHLAPIRGTLKTAYTKAPLPLLKLSKDELKKTYVPRPNFQSAQAQHMIEILDAGEKLPEQYDAALEVWQFGDDLTLVALPAEPVAEYVQLLHEKLGKQKLWIAGYNNDCFGYLPTKKVIEEGGHEAIGITLWAWGQDLHTYDAFFDPSVQDVIVNTTAKLAADAGRKTNP